MHRHWVKKNNVKSFFLFYRPPPHPKKNPGKDFLGFGIFHLGKSGSLAFVGSWAGAKNIKCLSCDRTEVLFDFLGENKLREGEAS